MHKLPLYILITLIVFSMTLPAYAATLQWGDEFTLNEDEVVSDDLYVAGGNTIVSGTIQGDLYATGGNLFIGGNITEDVSVAGGSVNIPGTIGDDLRVLGGSVVISGTVAGDLIIVGGAVHLAPGGAVGGDLITAAGDVRIDGTVTGAIRGVSGSLIINGTAGSVDTATGELSVTKNARINGDLTYKAPEEATLTEGATILGETTFTQKDQPGIRNAGNLFGVARTAISIVKLLVFLVAGLILLWIFPRSTRSTTVSALNNFWPQVLRGLIALIVVPVVGIILLVTIVGIPFGIIALTAYILTLAVASIFFVFTLGTLVEKWLRKEKSHHTSWLTLIIGLLVSFALSFVPLIGWLVIFAFFLATLGALTQAWQKRVWRERK